MSGGQLVVLDRLSRDVKRFALSEGLVTLGSDHSCDIRFMLDTVNPHHATVAVHANQTVVRNVSEGETLVNGRAVSVAALRHGDVISIGGRQLRWDYNDPSVRRPQAPQPALYVSRRKARSLRRGSGPAPSSKRSSGLQIALEMSHRASMPANAGGKQVAIVQPQRRDTSELNDKPPRSPMQAPKRPRASKGEPDAASDADADKASRKSTLRTSPKNLSLHNTTKATLWIESRKSSPRKSAKMQSPPPALSARRNAASVKKSTPLRVTLLKRAQSAQKMKVTKIEAPLTIDHTKQAAILLMTGHTPKSKLVSPNSSQQSLKTISPKSSTPKSASPTTISPNSASSKKSSSPVVRRSASFVVQKRSPGHRRSRARGRKSNASSAATPRNRTTILEIPDSEGRDSTLRNSRVRRSATKSLDKSPLLPSPRKSALKNPAKKSMRKNESIKFDLSNLDNYSQDSDVVMVDSTQQDDSVTEEDVTLRYSESSTAQTPSPRRSIHSRSSKILEKTLGTTMTVSPPSRTLTPVSPRRKTFTPESPVPRKSLRASSMVDKVLNESDDTRSYSRRTTKSMTNTSHNTVESAFRTRTLSPRSPQNDLESYSIVDLVSIDSNESGRSTSVYNSAGSNVSTAFGTPRNTISRQTRSTIDPTLVGSSTPYVKVTRNSNRSQSSPNLSTRGSALTNKSSVSSRKSSLGQQSPSRQSTASRQSSTSRQSTASRQSSGSRQSASSRQSSSSRKTKSISTPENTTNVISVNSTKISRASRSRSRINDSDLLLVESETDDSPRSSRKASSGSKRSSSAPQRASKKFNATYTGTPPHVEGISTPENNHSPEEATTPILSIQSLLDLSHSSLPAQSKHGRPSLKRKTIGVLTRPKARVSTKSKSMNFSARSTRHRLSSDSYENMNVSTQQDGEVVTPKSAVKLVQDAVKHKHSTAKKPQSKRSIIDDLNDSDIVKQLFNSPVKRKLSQSMTEFSRKQLFDEDEIVQARRPTRNTVAMTGRSPDNSLLDQTEAITPERFVSPMSTPRHSPNLEGIKLMFARNSPQNDLRNVRGVKAMLRTPRARKSIKNDLTNVTGVKAVFARSPRNRLSDVRVKEVFVSLPKNDLTRVSGVKPLFQTTKARKSPRNSLGDVRGVKKLFTRKSAANDLTNVSGVKKTMQRRSPKNDLRDVRGVKLMFTSGKPRNELNDVSGVAELFNESNNSRRDIDSTFDQLLGKPPIKAVYSKTFVQSAKKKRGRKAKSLHAPVEDIANHPEEWLEQELRRHLERTHKKNQSIAKSANKSKSIVKSVNKSKTIVKSANKSNNNLPRELQKLATNTVEGSTPIRTSRVRNSAVAAVPKRHKSKSHSVSRREKQTLELTDLSGIEALFNDDSLLNKSIGRLNKSPVVTPSKSVGRRSKSAGTPNKSAARLNISVGSPNKSAPTLSVDTNKTAGTPRKSVSRQSRSAGSHNKSAAALNKSPRSPNKSAGTLNISPSSTSISAGIPNKSASTPNKSSGSPNKSPGKQVRKSLSFSMKAKLNKSRKSHISETANKSITRELLKLATNTVEGNEPIRVSRARNSTIRTSHIDIPQRQKSASELYSAHTLPIKKRSLVDASLERAKSNRSSNNLPIKKRAVVHSTPVKGRLVNITMNASELGRVSPIVAEKTQDLDNEAPRTNTPKVSTIGRPKGRRGTKAAQTTKSPAKISSPKVTRGKSKVPTPTKAKPATPTKEKSPAKASLAKRGRPPKASPASKSSPAKPKTKAAKAVTAAASPKPTRSRRAAAATPKLDTKKRAATLVVTKKTPVMSPKPKATRKRKETETLLTPKASPKRTRGTKNNNQKIEKPKTPKTTRAKVQKATVVVSKPSPVIKPRATRGKAQQSGELPKENKTARGKKVESPKKSPRTKPVKGVSVEVVAKTRGSKPAAKDDSKQTEQAAPKTKRGRNTTAEEPVVTRKTRKTEVIQAAPKPKKTESPKKVAERKTKSKKVESPKAPVEEAKKTRGRKAAAVESQAEPTARSRRGNQPESAPETNSRKRKSTAADDRPAKVSKVAPTRGRGKKVESPKKEVAAKKDSKAKKAVAKEVSPVKKTTRSKKTEVETPKETEKKPVRGKKTAAVEPAAAAGKRKRNAAVDSPPVQVVSKKARGVKNAAVKSPASPARTRATRAAKTSEPVTTAGRSRRR